MGGKAAAPGSSAMDPSEIPGQTPRIDVDSVRCSMKLPRRKPQQK